MIREIFEFNSEGQMLEADLNPNDINNITEMTSDWIANTEI